jgi:hypothetical protein
VCKPKHDGYLIDWIVEVSFSGAKNKSTTSLGGWAATLYTILMHSLVQVAEEYPFVPGTLYI